MRRFFKKKLKVGWSGEKKKNNKIISKMKKYKNTNNLLKNVIIRPKKISIGERIVKGIIWLALHLVIRPTHWKNDRKNYQIIDRAYKRIMDPDFVFIPPAFAFYLIMAFLPITLLTLLIISNVPWISDYAISALAKFLKGGSSSLIAILNSLRQVKAAGFVAIIALIFFSFWLASAGFAKFVFTQSYIYEHDNVGGYWRNRLRGMVIVLWISIYFVILSASLAFIPHFIEVLQVKQNTTAFNVLFMTFMSIICFVYFYLGFIALFKFSPRFKLTWKQVHPGALSSTIPIALFILLFSQLTRVIFKYDVYGPFAIFMILAAAMFQVSYFIYVGIIVNVVFYKTHHGGATIPKRIKPKK